MTLLTSGAIGLVLASGAGIAIAFELKSWLSLFDKSGWILEEQIGLEAIGKILLLRKNKLKQQAVVLLD